MKTHVTFEFDHDKQEDRSAYDRLMRLEQVCFLVSRYAEWLRKEDKYGDGGKTLRDAHEKFWKLCEELEVDPYAL